MKRPSKTEIVDQRVYTVYVDGNKIEWGEKWSIDGGHLHVYDEDDRQVACYAPGSWGRAGFAV